LNFEVREQLKARRPPRLSFSGVRYFSSIGTALQQLRELLVELCFLCLRGETRM
jgi:hypothetical protein